MNHVTCRNYSSNHFIGFDIPSLSVRFLTIIYINHEKKERNIKIHCDNKTVILRSKDQVGVGLGG